MNLTGRLVAPQPRTRRLSTRPYSRSGHTRALFSSSVIYSSGSVMFPQMFAPVNSTKILS